MLMKNNDILIIHGTDYKNMTIRLLEQAGPVSYTHLVPAAGWCTVVWRYLWHSGMHHSIQGILLAVRLCE